MDCISSYANRYTYIGSLKHNNQDGFICDTIWYKEQVLNDKAKTGRSPRSVKSANLADQ